VNFDLRPLPGIDAEQVIEEVRSHAFRVIEPRMKDIDPATGFEFHVLSEVEAFDIDSHHPAVAAVQALSGANDTAKVSFATEAGIFQGLGIPTVVCGPGSIDQAHKPNEFIARSQLRQCDVFLMRLGEKLAAGPLA
jgi:acetylornithine deacetylase